MEHEKKVQCINFAPGVQEFTLIWERISCLKDIPRNTWVHGYGKCSSTSVNGSFWALKFQPAGFSLCSFCCPAFMVGVLGKLILKRCLRGSFYWDRWDLLLGNKCGFHLKTSLGTSLHSPLFILPLFVAFSLSIINRIYNLWIIKKNIGVCPLKETVVVFGWPSAVD